MAEVVADNGAIASAGVRVDLNGNLGSAGAILLNTNGNVDVGSIDSSLSVFSEAVSLARATANNPVVVDNAVAAQAFADHNVSVNVEATGTPGNLTFNVNGDLTLNRLDFSAAADGINDFNAVAFSDADQSQAQAFANGLNSIVFNGGGLQPINIAIGGDLSTGDISGAQIDLQAGGNLTTGTLFSLGDINLTSTTGAITTGNIDTGNEAGRGNITLSAQEDINVGVNEDTPIIDATGIGAGGNIAIAIQGNFSLQDGQITTNADSEGEGGNISITANSLDLSNTQISTTTFDSNNTNNEGSNINLQVIDDTLLLQDNSTINTNGGNIDIEAEFILASPSQNNGNDIIASSQAESDDNINITAESILGIQERRQNPSTNDIDASSELNLDFVLLNLPDVDFSQAEIQLPARIVSELIKLTVPTCTSQSQDSVSSEEDQIPNIDEIIPAQGMVVKENGEIILTPYPTGNGKRLPADSDNPNCPT